MTTTCTGNVEIWDQTVGCPTCGEELWNYPGIDELGITVEEYEERFYARHPFMFDDGHDDGDEDAGAWAPPEPPDVWWVPPPFFRGRGGYMTRGGSS